MELPHAELLAPTAVVDLVASIPSDAEVAAVFGRAKDFDELTQYRSLEYLWVSGVREENVATVGEMTWPQLTHLRRLRLASIRVNDGSLRPLHGLQCLRDVFIAKMFSDSELRAAAAALPLARGEYLDSFRAGS